MDKELSRKKIINIKGRANSGNVLLIFESGEYLSINIDLVYKFKLAKNVILEIEDYEKIKHEQEIFRAKNYAHNYCSRRVRSEKEIRTALIRKGFNNEVITPVISFLKEFNLINDENYIKIAIDYFKKKNFGFARIKLELLKKGLSKTIIEQFLNTDLISQEEELENALKIIEKKRRIIFSKEKQKRNAYIIHLLQSRGFNLSITRNILEKLNLENTDEIE